MNEVIRKRLAGCEIAADGSGARISFRTPDGSASSVLLTPESLYQLLMTLPRAISLALKAQHKDRSRRLVFPLSDWQLETAHSSDKLILTLVTSEGFEVAFAVGVNGLAGMLVTADSQAEAPRGTSKLLN